MRLHQYSSFENCFHNRRSETNHAGHAVSIGKAHRSRKSVAAGTTRLNMRSSDDGGSPDKAPRFPLRTAEIWTEFMSTSLVSELARLADEFERDESSLKDVSLEILAGKIAKELRVKSDEVAILGVSNRWRHLHFLVPAALKHVGFIPLTSNSALAAKTVRESRPEINNEFAKVRHASVFEGVKAATTTGESIQKIISAPILCEEKVVGVMQVSRKGENAGSAGADFTSDDLGKVLALCRPLGRLVRYLAGE